MTPPNLGETEAKINRRFPEVTFDKLSDSDTSRTITPLGGGPQNTYVV